MSKVAPDTGGLFNTLADGSLTSAQVVVSGIAYLSGGAPVAVSTVDGFPVQVLGTVPVSGPLTDAQLRATAVPVSLTSTTITGTVTTAPTSVSGSVTLLMTNVANVVSLNAAALKGYLKLIAVPSTWTGSLLVQGSLDNSTWFQILGMNSAGAVVSSFNQTQSTPIDFFIQGLPYIRLKVFVTGSGTGTIRYSASDVPPTPVDIYGRDSGYPLYVQSTGLNVYSYPQSPDYYQDADDTGTYPQAATVVGTLYGPLAVPWVTLRSESGIAIAATASTPNRTDTGLVTRSASDQCGTGTLSNVSGSASSVQLLSDNTARVGLIVYNDSSAIMYLKFGITASATSFSVLIPANSRYDMPRPIYTGRIDAIWASATGAARITELTY